ncbi:hypothetical protein YC2023_101816 [Brassica napus]
MVNHFFSDQIQSKSALREIYSCSSPLWPCLHSRRSKAPIRPHRRRFRVEDNDVVLLGSKGNLLHKIDTRLYASSYGEDELISHNQSLYIKQATSATSVADEEEEEAEWVEYKIKETNMFTVDKYQHSADWILPQGESLFIEVSNRCNVGYHLKARRSRRR